MKEFYNYSGGALGSDSEWDRIGRLYGFNNHFHFYHGKKTPLGNIELTEEELEEGWKHVLKANETLKRNPNNYKSLLSRNWFQVKDSEIIIAISTFKLLPKGNYFDSQPKPTKQVEGGTSWAIQMAIDDKKPWVLVFDQNEEEGFGWNIWNYVFNDWQSFPEEEVYLLEKYAGIGTRNINEKGKQAIETTYKNTIEKWKPN